MNNRYKLSNFFQENGVVNLQTAMDIFDQWAEIVNTVKRAICYICL
jgi:hypothetical protein